MGLILCASNIVFADVTPREGQFYHFLRPFQARSFEKKSSGKWEPTGETILFREGDFFKVDAIGPNGTLWVKVSSTDGEAEMIGIHPESIRRGESVLGQADWVQDTEWLRGRFDYRIREKNVRPLHQGQATFFGRWLGEKGIDDAVVYFDSEPGARLALTSEPSGSEGTAWPTTGDSLKVVDSTVSYIKDPITGDTSPRLFYKVRTTYCPSGTVEACSEKLQVNKEGWVEARRVGTVKREAIPKVNSPYIPNSILGSQPSKKALTEKPKVCPAGAVNKQVHNLQKVLDASDVDFELNVKSKVGECLSYDYVGRVHKIDDAIDAKRRKNHHGRWSAELGDERRKKIAKLGNEFFKDGLSPFDRFVQSSRDLRPRQSVTGNQLTNQQLFEIDALARSLFGEMRGCHEQSDAYYKAIARVMLNRAAIVKAKGPTLPFVRGPNSGDQGDSVDLLLPEVVSAYKQISSWNRDDVNLWVNVCPLNDRTSPQEAKAWDKAVKVAWEVVMKRKNFIKETNEITHTHYSSGMIPSWSSSKKEDIKFKVGSETFSNSQCLILWRDSDNRKIKELSKDPKNFAESLPAFKRDLITSL